MDCFNYPYPVKQIVLDNNVSIAYVDEGIGKQTLLMIHGLGSYLPAWQKNIAGLKDHFRCIALDLPNYGKSTKGDFPFTMNFFAETISDFVQKLQLKNVTLVGHSMGAQIAISFLLDTSRPIEKLVLIAPAGFETFSPEEQAFFYKNVTAKSVRDLSIEQIRSNFDANFHNNQVPDDALFMFEDRLAMRSNEKEYAFHCQMIPKCVRGMLEAPVFDKLENIKVPTLIIYGREDHLIPNKFLHPELTTQQVAESGHKKIPDSQLSIVSPAGHFAQWDCPGQVNELIVRFLIPD